MQARLLPATRLPRPPRYAVIAGAIWLALGLTHIAVAEYTHHQLVLCPMKLTCHVPCPTCGATRGGLALIHGDMLGPWRFNPMLFTLLALALAYYALRAVTGRAVNIQSTRRERRAFWAGMIVLAVVNWGYVIVWVG